MTDAEKQVLGVIFNWHSERGSLIAENTDSIASVLPNLSKEQINSAIDSLKERGMIKALQIRGGFVDICLPPRQWASYGRDFLDFDPRKDIDVVYRATKSLGGANGEEIAQAVDLPFGRVDMAVCVLEAQGRLKCLFEHPAPGGYSFSRAI